MKTSQRLRVGLLGLVLLVAAMVTVWADASGAQAPSAGPTTSGAPPSYEEIVAMARREGQAAPSLFAYRLVLRFSPKDASGTQAEIYDLVKEADLAIRFGSSPQEAGLRIRQMAALATRHDPLAEGMARLMREEDRRSRSPGSGFGGPERGAGFISPGLGRLSWGSASAVTGSRPGANIPASQLFGGGGAGGTGSPTGGSGMHGAPY